MGYSPTRCASAAAIVSSRLDEDDDDRRLAVAAGTMGIIRTHSVSSEKGFTNMTRRRLPLVSSCVDPKSTTSALHVPAPASSAEKSSVLGRTNRVATRTGTSSTASVWSVMVAKYAAEDSSGSAPPARAPSPTRHARATQFRDILRGQHANSRNRGSGFGFANLDPVARAARAEDARHRAGRAALRRRRVGADVEPDGAAVPIQTRVRRTPRERRRIEDDLSHRHLSIGAKFGGEELRANGGVGRRDDLDTVTASEKVLLSLSNAREGRPGNAGGSSIVARTTPSPPPSPSPFPSDPETRTSPRSARSTTGATRLRPLSKAKESIPPIRASSSFSGAARTSTVTTWSGGTTTGDVSVSSKSCLHASMRPSLVRHLSGGGFGLNGAGTRFAASETACEMVELTLAPETSTRVTCTDRTVDTTDWILRGTGFGLNMATRRYRSFETLTTPKSITPMICVPFRSRYFPSLNAQGTVRPPPSFPSALPRYSSAGLVGTTGDEAPAGITVADTIAAASAAAAAQSPPARRRSTSVARDTPAPGSQS